MITREIMAGLLIPLAGTSAGSGDRYKRRVSALRVYGGSYGRICRRNGEMARFDLKLTGRAA